MKPGWVRRRGSDLIALGLGVPLAYLLWPGHLNGLSPMTAEAVDGFIHLVEWTFPLLCIGVVMWLFGAARPGDAASPNEPAAHPAGDTGWKRASWHGPLRKVGLALMIFAFMVPLLFYASEGAAAGKLDSTRWGLLTTCFWIGLILWLGNKTNHKRA